MIDGPFVGGVFLGAFISYISLLLFLRYASPQAKLIMGAGDEIMAIIAGIQAEIDRLAAIPAVIEAEKTAAVAAATTQASQDAADSTAALTSAVDGVRTAAGLPLEG